MISSRGMATSPTEESDDKYDAEDDDANEGESERSNCSCVPGGEAVLDREKSISIQGS